MKKTFIRIISCMMVVIMALTSTPLGGFVELELPKWGELFATKASALGLGDSGKCGDNVTYYLDNDGVLTISGTGEMWDYHFNHMDDYSQFSYNDIVSRVEIKNGVTSIGDNAFYRCTNLTSITIPNSVKSIGESAFYYCERLSNIIIPNGAINIGDCAFSNCTSLTSITIPSSVTSVGYDAFCFCFCLNQVNWNAESINDFERGHGAFRDSGYASGGIDIIFGDSVKNIPKYLFSSSGSTSVKSIKIGNSVTKIDQASFFGCTGLTSVTIGNNVECIGAYSFSGYPLKEIMIPDNVKTIGEYAFYRCKDLTSVTIPNSVESMGAYLFAECTSLTSVIIPSSVTSIGDYAFDCCSSLIKVTIPDGITSIGDHTFCYCKALEDISIPSSVTSIGDSAFSGCSKLASIKIPDSVTSIGEWAFQSCSGLTSMLIPNSVTNIGQHAFQDCENLTSIIVPNSVTSIGDGAFSNCRNITSIAIPSGITNIGNDMFFGCRNLISITIPNGVTDIGNYAFYNCYGLTSITIPNGVTSIGYRAFYDCKSLGDVYYTGSETEWKKISIGSDNKNLTRATIHYNSKAPVDTGTSTVVKLGEFVNIRPRQNDYNEKFFVLPNVTAQYGSMNVTTDSANRLITLKKNFELQPLKLTKDGFRDYIVPYNVVNSLKEGSFFDAYMTLDKKDGKPYISSAFGKNSDEGEYKNLFKTALTAENENKYDIVVTAVGLDSPATYYIKQDSTTYLESKTGVFSREDLFSKLKRDKSVYVYAKDSKGRMTDLEPILISKSSDDGMLKNILNTSTYGLGGTGGITIKIPDENPIFGNSEISLKAFTAPVTFYYDRTNDTFIGTIGWDLYSYTQTDKTVKYTNSNTSLTSIGDGETKKAIQNFKESFSYFNKKPFAEDKEDRYGKTYKQQWESFVNRCKTSSKYSTEKRDKNFSTDFLGYLEFSFADNNFVIKEASLKVGTKFSYSYTYQGAVWVIPAYFKASLGAAGSLEGSAKRVIADSSLPFEFDITLDLEPNLALEAGIGVEKLAKAGIEAKGTVPIKVEFLKQHFKMDLHGEINIKTKAFVFSWDKKLCEGTLNVCDKYYGKSKNKSPVRICDNSVSTIGDGLSVNKYYDGVESFVSRDYSDDTSGWLGKRSLGERLKSKRISTDSIYVKALQKSVFDAGKPVTVNVEDKMLMAWIEDDSSRNEYNRMRLMYSLYDGESWSTPSAVYDDGKNDDAPVIVSDGKKVYFAWQKITETLNSSSTAAKALQKVDIYTACYNSETGKIENVQAIANNGYDYAQSITLENGKPSVYFASCPDETTSTSFNNTIYKFAGGTKNSLVSKLPFVQSIASSGKNMSYIVDTDNSLDTYDDINVVSYSGGSNNKFDKKELSTALTSAYYGTIGGKELLFVSDGSNIYYYDGAEQKAVFGESHKISNLNALSSDGNCMFTWTESTDGGDEIYSVKYDENGWSEPYKIVECENYNIDSLDIAQYNGKLIGVFMQNELDGEENSITQTNLAFLSASDFCDVSVDCLTADEENIVPGQSAEVTAYVSNNGSQTVKNVTFKIRDGIGSEQTVTKEVNLKAGSAENITLTYAVPTNFKRTNLTVSAEVEEQTDKESSNNSASLEIGVPDYHFSKYELAQNGDYYIVTIYVENQSQTASDGLTAQLFLNEDETGDVFTSEIESLSNDEVGITQFYINKNLVEFNEDLSAKLYCKFVDENSKFGASATECIVISKPTDVCAHPETEDIEALSPTCSKDGHTGAVRCLACGEFIKKQETIPATGKHTYGAWETTKQPTCTATGTRVHTCTACGKIETQTIDKTEHKPVTVKGTPATCTKDGLTDGTKCSVCGEIIKAQKVIKSTGVHTYSAWKVTKHATCTAEGKQEKTCSVCGKTETKVIKVTSHKPVTIKAVSATCEKAGKTAGEKCSVCGKVLKAQTTIKATGHKFGAWKTAKKATYTATGTQKRKCMVCGKTETKTIAKLKTTAITKCTFMVKSADYTGKAVKPAVTVKNGKTTLKLNTHYKVSCKNNTKIGKATVTITGVAANGYTGTKALSFNIIPANVKNLKAAQTTSSIKLTWSKVNGATGYRVYRHDGKKWVKVADTKNTSYTVSKLKAGTSYKYAVRAYATVGKTTYWAASYPTITTTTKPATPTLKAIAGTKQAVLSWNKIAGATGYEVWMSTSKNGSYKKFATIKKNATVKYTAKNLKKGGTYYFRVRAYKTVNGKNIYGAYSDVKSVKVK